MTKIRPNSHRDPALKIAIREHSDLSSTGRMDVPFHIALSEHREDVEKLCKSKTREQMQEVASSLPEKLPAWKIVNRYSQPFPLNNKFSDGYTNVDIALFLILSLKDETESVAQRSQELRDSATKLETTVNRLREFVEKD